MRKLEYKSQGLELSDMSREHRTAVIAHATYDNIDRLGDICRKGMFNKSWSEQKASDIGFFINHDPNKTPGVSTKVFEDDKHAYTEVKFANTAYGNDILEMTDMGIIKGASFGFVPTRREFKSINGKKVRELKEVYHAETTLVHGKDFILINPESGVKIVKKAGEVWFIELQNHIKSLENFCRNSSASDECIIKMEIELKAIQDILSQGIDTEDTSDIMTPSSSVNGNVVATYADEPATRGRRQQLLNDDNDPENEPDNDEDELIQRLALIHANI